MADAVAGRCTEHVSQALRSLQALGAQAIAVLGFLTMANEVDHWLCKGQREGGQAKEGVNEQHLDLTLY